MLVSAPFYLHEVADQGLHVLRVVDNRQQELDKKHETGTGREGYTQKDSLEKRYFLKFTAAYLSWVQN
jgi:hypothetical protein